MWFVVSLTSAAECTVVDCLNQKREIKIKYKIKEEKEEEDQRKQRRVRKGF